MDKLTLWIVLKMKPNSKPPAFEQLGPFPTEVVIQMLTRGEIGYQDFVWTDGQSQWTKIKDLPVFAGSPGIVATIEKAGQKIAADVRSVVDDLLSTVLTQRDLELTQEKKPDEAGGVDLVARHVQEKSDPTISVKVEQKELEATDPVISVVRQPEIQTESPQESHPPVKSPTRSQAQNRVGSESKASIENPRVLSARAVKQKANDEESAGFVVDVLAKVFDGISFVFALIFFIPHRFFVSMPMPRWAWIGSLLTIWLATGFIWLNQLSQRDAVPEWSDLPHIPSLPHMDQLTAKLKKLFVSAPEPELVRVEPEIVNIPNRSSAPTSSRGKPNSKTSVPPRGAETAFTPPKAVIPGKVPPTFVKLRFEDGPDGRMLKLQTDASNHFTAIVTVEGKSGQILFNRSYYYQAAVKLKRSDFVLLKGIPDGNYLAKANIEGKEGALAFQVGNPSAKEFREQLAKHRKRTSQERSSEKVDLIRQLKKLSELSTSFYAKANALSGSSTEWKKFLLQWRRDFDRLSSLRNRAQQAQRMNALHFPRIWIDADRIRRDIFGSVGEVSRAINVRQRPRPVDLSPDIKRLIEEADQPPYM